MGDCLEWIHSTWLASFCFPPRLQDQPTEAEPAVTGISKFRSDGRLQSPAEQALEVGSTTEVWSEQPAVQPPPKYSSVDLDRSLPPLPRPPSPHRPPTSRYRHSTVLPERKSLGGRPLSIVSLRSTRRTRRPKIGAPTDFKKVQSGRISPIRRAPPFRPLQLTIYLPGNELPDLPIFWKDEETIKEEREEREEGDVELQRPAQALVKSRSDSLLLHRPSSTFSIPRKPVPSRSSSIDATRFSIDNYITSNPPTQLQPRQSQSAEGLRSVSLDHETRIRFNKGRSDFLDALDCKFPRPPPNARIRSSSEPEFTIYRKASDQSLRLRTHLEERQNLQKNLPDLSEEVSPISRVTSKKLPLSPIPDRSPIVDEEVAGHDGVSEAEHAPQEKDWEHHGTSTEQLSFHRPHSSTGSSTLLNPLREITRAEAPSVTTHILSMQPSQSSLRSRLSQWLLKALPTAPVPSPAPEWVDDRRASTPLSAFSEAVTANELSRMHKKQSSIGSSFLGRGSVDVEKTMGPCMPSATSVGVAY